MALRQFSRRRRSVSDYKYRTIQQSDHHAIGRRAAATDGFAFKLNEQVELADTTAVGGAWGDPLSTLQWDMLQIHVPEAQAVTMGSSSVVVGHIDTGLD